MTSSGTHSQTAELGEVTDGSEKEKRKKGELGVSQEEPGQNVNIRPARRRASAEEESGMRTFFRFR